MKNVNLAVRKAVIQALVSIPYKMVNIPVYEEYAQPTASRPIATFNVGNMPVQAYVIVQNQTANENTNVKCNRKDEASVQLNINTVFPDNKGGSLTAEEISEVIMLLMPNLTLPTPFYVQKFETVTVRNLNYDTQTNRIWTTVLVLNFTVSQS